MSVADPGSVELRPAATVMLVRDGTAGPEVMMVRRHPGNVFVGGAYVFPGGAVDPGDRAGSGGPVVGLADIEASLRLGVEGDGLAYWVAAIRETFEEAGILLAYDTDGQIVALDEPSRVERFERHRAAVDAGRMSMAELCAGEQLTLATDAVHYFGHWVTPVGPPRRYDTRFFVARAPERQVVRHDERETVGAIWIRPAEALERSAAGEIDVIQPTARNLEAIARFDDVESMLEAVESVTSTPDLVPDEGGMRIRLPGDPTHGAPLHPAPTHGDHE